MRTTLYLLASKLRYLIRCSTVGNDQVSWSNCLSRFSVQERLNAATLRILRNSVLGYISTTDFSFHFTSLFLPCTFSSRNHRGETQQDPSEYSQKLVLAVSKNKPFISNIFWYRIAETIVCTTPECGYHSEMETHAAIEQQLQAEQAQKPKIITSEAREKMRAEHKKLTAKVAPVKIEESFELRVPKEIQKSCRCSCCCRTAHR